MALHSHTTMNTTHNLSEIRQVAVTVSDVGTALPFYRDVLARAESRGGPSRPPAPLRHLADSA